MAAKTSKANRFSLGTKNKDLVFAKDGSLTIYIQADSPSEAQRANWLPSPQGDYTLYLRAYWPKVEVIDGSWTPAPRGKPEIVFINNNGGRNQVFIGPGADS